MLKVILEIHPFGDADKKYTIDEYFIENMGYTGNDDECLYHCFTNETDLVNRENFISINHRRSDGAEVLVKKFLQKLTKGRK